MRHGKARKVLDSAPFDRPAEGEGLADDPGSVPAPQPRRRRRPLGEAGFDATPAEGAEDPIDAQVPDTAEDDTPLPTFVHGPGGGVHRSGVDVDQWMRLYRVDPERHSLARPVDQRRLPLLDDRSPDPEICPFLRAVDATDRLGAPVETPDVANRCAALRDAVPQSLRQQELVCLSSGHVNCPRYLRGAVVVADTPEPVVSPGRSMSPAILASLLALVLSASASVAFVMARGGLELAAALPTATPLASVAALAQASASPIPTTASTPMVTPEASASATPAPTRSPATPSPSPAPTPSQTAPPTPKATARATPRPEPTSDRYALLRACPDAPRCWIYRVRAGDNIYSIANYFGVSQASIYSRNPFLRNGLRAGQDLRLPPPTR